MSLIPKLLQTYPRYVLLDLSVRSFFVDWPCKRNFQRTTEIQEKKKKKAEFIGYVNFTIDFGNRERVSRIAIWNFGNVLEIYPYKRKLTILYAFEE